MKFTDRLMLDGAIRITKDGYAIASARVARGGNVQSYLGSELGITDKDVIRVYRPEAEVFKKDALASYAGVPVTVGHPSTAVDASNWKEHAVGEAGEEVLRDGEFVRVPLMLRDNKAIDALKDGKRELSMGYEAQIHFMDGMTPTGEAFDAVMSDFKMNHVALCKVARGGAELRFGDNVEPNSWGASPVRHKPNDERKVTMELRKVLVDGLQVETTEQGATAIAKLTNDLLASAARLTDAGKAHDAVLATRDADHAKAIAAKDAVIADKDKTLAAKDAEIDALKGKIISDADLDKRVAERASLISKSTAIVKAAGKNIKFEGLADAAIRKAVVTAVLGDEAVKDKADAYIDARFEILTEDHAKNVKAAGGTDPFAVIRQDTAPVVSDAEKVRLAAEAADRDAWKGTKAA